MKGIIARSLGLSLVLAATTVTLTAGESPKAAPKAKNAGVPQVTDWSHQHMIFSRPRTPEQAARVEGNVRYRQQQQRLTTRPKLALPIDESRLVVPISAAPQAPERPKDAPRLVDELRLRGDNRSY